MLFVFEITKSKEGSFSDLLHNLLTAFTRHVDVHANGYQILI